MKNNELMLHKDRLTGRQIRYLMRKYRVTIDMAATRLGITKARVRYVRKHGVEGYAYVLDWCEVTTGNPYFVENLERRDDA